VTGSFIIAIGAVIIAFGIALPALPQTMVSLVTKAEPKQISSQIVNIGIILVFAGIISNGVVLVLRNLKVIR
jgi:hypothetical protein